MQKTKLFTSLVFSGFLFTSIAVLGAPAKKKAAPPSEPVSVTETVKEPAAESWVDKFEATWKKGLSVKSKDGNYSAKFRFVFVPRFDLNILENEDDTHTFRVRRAKFSAEGNLFNPNLNYKLQLSLTASKFEDFLEDAMVEYRFHDALTLRGGQFKIPYNRQQISSGERMQFPDRSLAADEFQFSTIDRKTLTKCTLSNGDILSGENIECEGVGVTSEKINKDTTRRFAYDIGLMVHGKLFDKKLEYGLAVTNGSGFNRLNLNQDYLYSGRLVWNILGEYGYSESDVDHSEKPSLALGANVGYNVQDQTKTKFLQGGVDLGFKYRGASLQAEYFMRQNDPEGEDNTTTDHGYYVQGGYFILPKHLEVVARASQVLPEGEDNDRSEFAGGLNYYFFGHDLKAQVDYSFLPKQKDDVQDHRVRLQLQAWF